MEIRPTELGILRDDVMEFMDRHGVSFLQKTRPDLLRNQASSWDVSIAEAARETVSNGLAALAKAELFYVAGPMMELAWAAAPALPAFELLPEDVPSREGFIYFDAPMSDVDVDDVNVRVVAASWQNVDSGLWVRWYVEAGERFRMARLIHTSDTLIPYGQGPNAWVHEGGAGPRETLVLKSIWLLMMQSVASSDDAAHDRASSRRYKRERKEAPRVRVINLRRIANSGTSEGSREYHHQWIVRGHWRQQWYPVRQVHRPVWIAPHIKGPEGAPLLGGEKVYALRR